MVPVEAFAYAAIVGEKRTPDMSNNGDDTEVERHEVLRPPPKPPGARPTVIEARPGRPATPRTTGGGARPRPSSDPRLLAETRISTEPRPSSPMTRPAREPLRSRDPVPEHTPGPATPLRREPTDISAHVTGAGTIRLPPRPSSALIATQRVSDDGDIDLAGVGPLDPISPTVAPAPEAGNARLDEVIAERDKALKAVAAREGILQVVAHDLRNPLNLVKVGGSLLTRLVKAHADPAAGPIDAGRVTQVADTLTIAVRRMERLVSDLLDLEALDKGQLRLVRGPANANVIVEEVLVEMRAKATEKKVEILGELPKAPVVIDCDKDRIAQILENLIGNAIRFTPEGKQIVVRLKEQGSEARFEVADQGPGISDHDLRRIFDPYYRAQIPQGRGLGLGLSISLGLVRAHDGAIWAESAAGHGANFVFTMPRRDIARDTMVEIPAIKIPPPPRRG